MSDLYARCINNGSQLPSLPDMWAKIMGVTYMRVRKKICGTCMIDALPGVCYTSAVATLIFSFYAVNIS